MLKKLLERRAELVAKCRKIHEAAEAENRDLNTEERAEWDKIDAEITALEQRIDRAQRLENLSADGDDDAGEERGAGRLGGGAGGDGAHLGSQANGPTEEDRALALQAWMLHGTHRDDDIARVTDRHRRSLQACNVSPLASEVEIRLRPAGFGIGRNIRLREMRAQSSQIGADGGYTVPAGFMAGYERALLQFGGLLNYCTVWRTADGRPTPYPTVNDTSNEGELVGENQAVTEQKFTTGSILFGARKVSSKLVLVPYELMRDSAFNLSTFLADVLGERIARRANRMFTTGTGAGLEAQGLITAAPVGKTAASATAVTIDELMDLMDAVDAAYHDRASWMAHSKIWSQVRRLKSGDGMYLWQPSLIPGVPDTFLGFPAARNNSMASALATTAKTFAFGDLSKYFVREVGGVRIRRMVERYGEYDQDGYVAFAEYDGALVNAGTNPVQVLQQA